MASKRLRFEIFKRDGFTCQYCGRRPPDVVLELDHIDPRVSGGSDDQINLITACFDCNRGKADKKLTTIQPRPDADLAFLEVQQEIAEAKRYLDASKARDEIRKVLQERLEEIWCTAFDTDMVPLEQQWQSWLKTFPAEEIEESIRIAASQRVGRYGSVPSSGFRLIQYVSGILWNRLKREAQQ